MSWLCRGGRYYLYIIVVHYFEMYKYVCQLSSVFSLCFVLIIVCV
jgi:hypothetical protein